MDTIPANDDVTEKDLADWFVAQRELAAAKSKEALLRSRCFRGFFTNCLTEVKEGVNSYDLSDGSILKGTRVVNRTVLKELIDAHKETFEKANIKIDDLIRWKPELKVGDYKKLTAEEQKIVDQILEIKDGSPSMEIKAGKAK